MLRLLKEILLSNLLWESLILSFVVCNMNEKLKKEIDEMKELDIFQMWCWLEDLWITDRYEAMEYWYNKAIEWILERWEMSIYMLIDE